MRLYKRQIVIVFLLCFPLFSQASEHACVTAHKQAVGTCKAHENNVSAEQIKVVSVDTRVRVAKKETRKLFGMGQSCAKAQKKCQKVCSTSNTPDGGLDITDLIELSSDCAEGRVAESRSQLAEKYLNMKAVLEESRKPANQ